MYKIQLTRGVAWDSPVLEEQFVKYGVHIGYVERMAQRMLYDVRRGSRTLWPTNYRIVDAFGRCVRSSTLGKTRPSAARSRRTPR